MRDKYGLVEGKVFHTPMGASTFYCTYVPWSKVAILGMVIQPLIGNPYNGYINPYYWVDDHPLLYGNNGSLDPSTYIYIYFFFIFFFSKHFKDTQLNTFAGYENSSLPLLLDWKLIQQQALRCAQHDTASFAEASVVMLRQNLGCYIPFV